MIDKNLKSIRDFIESQIDDIDLSLPSKRVLANTLTGALHMLYKHSEDLAKKSTPLSKDPDKLKSWASLFDIYQKPARPSEILVEVESTDEVFLESNTKWQHESGVEFYLPKSTTINGKSKLTLVCTSPGISGNVYNGGISVSATIANLKSSGRILKLTQEGFDTEALDSLRSRIKKRLRHPEHGGTAYDYIYWTLKYTSAKKAWILPRSDENLNTQNGHVCITFIKNSGLPTSEELEKPVSDIKRKCPVSTIPHAIAPKTIPLDVDLELSHDGTLSKNELTNRLRLEIQYMISSLAAPKGFTNIDLKEESGTIYISDISQAISIIPEIKHFRIIKPTHHVNPNNIGEMIVLGEVNI